MPLTLNRDKRIEKRVAMGLEDIRSSMFQVVENQLKGITKSRIEGMTDEAIFDAMDEGWEKSFLNAAAQEIWEGMKYVAQQSVYSSLPLSNLYQWQYNPGAKHCEVCTELNGQIKSLEEWQTDGLPGRRQEGCYANCCCDLVRVKSTKTESIRKNRITNTPLKMNINYSTFLERDFNAIFSETDSNGRVTEYLTRAGAEELYVTLNHVKKEMGGGRLTFKELDQIVCESLSNDTLGLFDSGFPSTGNKMSFNTDYYGPGANETNRALLTEYHNSLRNTARHESAHYLVWKYRVEKDPETDSFFNQNRTYILECFPFIANKTATGEDIYTEEQKSQEFFVEAFAWLLEGRLEKMGTNQELNKKIQSFMKKKVESLKQMERNYKKQFESLETQWNDSSKNK